MPVELRVGRGRGNRDARAVGRVDFVEQPPKIGRQ
jgi:hypothetical protein